VTTTQINGGTQIRANTVTSGQVDSSIIVAGGGNAFTGDQSFGSHKATNVSAPVSGTDAANKSYVDTAIASLSGKLAAVAATNTETLTIASGSVTQITGTTVDGKSPAVNDYVLIPNAPASTGAAGGSTLSSQPGNGLYQVTANTTNLTLSRASDMSGSVNPMGASIVVVGGPTWGGADLLVTTPSTSAAFTYGTGSIAFTQMSGAGEITVDSTLTKTGNQLSRPALTGDVTASTGSNATTIAAAAVTLSKMANLAANSVIGNNTGSSATPVAVPLSVAAGTPAASTIPLWDANVNLSTNALFSALASTATAAGTTTLTIASAETQVFTGSSTQTVKLPTTGVPAGAQYTIINESSGNVSIQSSGANAILTLTGSASAPFSAAVFTAKVATPTTAANWSYAQYATGTASGTVTSVSVATANGFAGTVATATSTPAITLTTSVTGVLKGNGTAISAATAGTDYMAPSDFITRETPSGTVNGSTTSFGLANTPISGTEMVFLNGVLQEPGAGNDYTISGATITYLTAPVTGDRIRVTYQK
jgi:hypothetical protein